MHLRAISAAAIAITCVPAHASASDDLILMAIV